VEVPPRPSSIGGQADCTTPTLSFLGQTLAVGAKQRAMSSGGETEEPRVGPRVVKKYPLNSRRLTALVVHRIAAALELPKAPLADARQMVEGFLSEDHEPQNVQVDLVESEDGSIMRLRDANGVFLEVAPGDSDGGDASVAASDGVEDGTEDPEVGRTWPETEAREGGGDSPSRGSARDADADFTEAERTEAEMALDAARERITGLETELGQQLNGTQTSLRR
jgi:hypothetical protein